MAGLQNNNNPFQSQVRLGVQSIQLVPGPPGPPGTSSAVVDTTANFTQPAVGATVSVAVTSTVPLAQGLGVFIQNAGYYLITSVVDGFRIIAQNLGTTGNASPGATITALSLVVPTGPPGAALTVQNNGSAITQRPILDLVGLAYSDDAGGGRMVFEAGVPAPGATIASNTSITAGQTWILFAQGPYTISMTAALPGVEYLLTHVSGALEGAGQVTLAASGFTIQDPQQLFLAPSSSVSLRTSGLTYRFILDATNSVLRCVN